jgi:hypothetical protein
MSRGIINIKDLYRPNFSLYTRQIYSLPICRNVAPSAPCRLLLFKIAARVPDVLAAAFSSPSPLEIGSSSLKHLSDGRKLPTVTINVCLPSYFLKLQHYNLNVWMIPKFVASQNMVFCFYASNHKALVLMSACVCRFDDHIQLSAQCLEHSLLDQNTEIHLYEPSGGTCMSQS